MRTWQDWVPTKQVNQAVKRNALRFPDDFMFQLTPEEVANLRSQFVTSSLAYAHGGRRYLPRAFTQEGVAMLSSVLNSTEAVEVNVEIMRAFVRLRSLAATNLEVMRRLRILEAEAAKQSAQLSDHKTQTNQALKVVFEVLKKLTDTSEEQQKESIGFKLS